ncbi:hypothetical protein [Streptomyces aureoverticillatus]|uniref:hypothetical protein n=1 Tax=Streptomyces aureoverticillatus TaxID=66871 RepID=UPI0013DA7EA5|nr:hypothetical protein [Streptomyces aureoverticillatus]QIB41950.1 hypothetical protein G3H79_01530 [Streptomyces aureoverticillatus]
MTKTRITAPRPGRLALAAGAALALLVALPMSSAHAASGSFLYESTTGESLRIDDPILGKCYGLYKAKGASNQTNATATIFFDANCEREWGSLQPGGYSSNFLATLYSVRFGS